jgi:ribosome maturation factor RimP
MGPLESIRDTIEPLVTTSGLELWDLELSNNLIRVLVDKVASASDRGSVDLDTLGQLTQSISAALDVHDELTPSGHYELEVSSPGVERRLRTPDQFRRFIGTPVTVKTTEPVKTTGLIEGTRRAKGVLVAADDAAIDVRPEGTDRPLRVPYEQIQTARTVLEWGPSPKPGKSGSRTKTKDAAL